MAPVKLKTDRRSAIVVGLIVVAIGGGLTVLLRLDPVVIPAIDPTGVHPEVAAGIESARDMVRQDPESGLLWGQLGLTLWAHEFNEPARVCFREAARLEPSEFRWPYFLGHLLYSNNREAAEAAFAESVHRGPDELLPRLRLAESLLDSADIAAAWNELAAALEISPDDPRANLRMAQYMYMRDSVPEALHYAEHAARHAPGHPAVLSLLGQLLAASGEQERAGQVLDRLRQLPRREMVWPDTLLAEREQFRLDPYWRAYRIRRISGDDMPVRMELLEQLVAQHPSSPVFRARLVRTLLSAGQLDEARRVLQSAPHELRDDFELKTVQAVVHLMSAQWTQAQRLFRELIERKPDSASLYLDLSHVLRQLGRGEEALEQVNRAITLEPASISASIERIRILNLLEQRDELQRALMQLQQSAPDSAEVRRLVDELASDSVP